MMKYRNLAEEVLNSTNQRWRVLAILCNKKVVSIALNNLEKTHPSMKDFNPKRRTHAEIRCIRKTPKTKLMNSVMYVWRINRKGVICASRPCKICETNIRKAGIKRVFFINQSGQIDSITR